MHNHGTKLAEILKSYSEERDMYESFSLKIHGMLGDLLKENEIAIYNIESRVKTSESLTQKIIKRQVESNIALKYESLASITDLAGVRIITVLFNSINKIDAIIRESFDVEEGRDVGDERFKQGKFGYQSFHYIVKFNESTVKLPLYKKYKGYKAEIQVRTILQHAWAHMEHNIQYKNPTELPTAIQKRFTSLAGLLEIADREFQAVYDADSHLRASIRNNELPEAIAMLLTENEANGVKKDPKEVKNGDNESELEYQSAKQLFMDKKYPEAIQAYTEIINLNPRSHTVYLARARAKFLNRDREGALDDIELARKVFPSDPRISVLWKQIGEGVLPERSDNDQWALSDALNFLELGKGDDAIGIYKKLHVPGLNDFIIKFHLAMACIVNRQLNYALENLTGLTPRRGGPMEINYYALRCIIYAQLSNRNFSIYYMKLTDSLRNSPNFHFNQSPLRFLKSGLEARGIVLNSDVIKVFDTLNNTTY